MMFEMDIFSLLTALGTLAGGGALGYITKTGRVKAKADAYKMMAESYEYRLSAANERIKTANETEATHLERISQLNHSLDGKTEQIRNLTQKLWESEQETNRVNKELVAREEEIGRLRLRVEHYREWRCYWHDCRDERGRKPRQERDHNEDGREPE